MRKVVRNDYLCGDAVTTQASIWDHCRNVLLLINKTKNPQCELLVQDKDLFKCLCRIVVVGGNISIASAVIKARTHVQAGFSFMQSAIAIVISFRNIFAPDCIICVFCNQQCFAPSKRNSCLELDRDPFRHAEAFVASGTIIIGNVNAVFWLKQWRCSFVSGKPRRFKTMMDSKLRVTHTELQYLAVPTDDKGVSDSAAASLQNIKWACPKRDQTTHMEWRAYQNLLQLTGILSTARIGNAREVWENAVDFVENTSMAELQIKYGEELEGSVTSAAKEWCQPQGTLRNKSSPPTAPASADLSAGSSTAGIAQQTALSPQQLKRIAENKEQALARKRARLQHETLQHECSPER